MTHAGYIIAAYVLSALVLAGVTAFILLDLRAQQRKLRHLEERGLRRTSEPAR